jgi:osmoprotectant transport system permease protein
VFRGTPVSIAAVIVCLLSACSPSKQKLTVGAEDTTEQLVLSELLAQHLSARTPLDVQSRASVGTVAMVHQALQMNEIDLYVENTGALAGSILKEKPDSDPSVAADRVSSELERIARVQFLAPLGFENPFVIVILKDDAQERKIQTLSQASEYTNPGWDFASSSDFQSRPDGYTVLQSNYRIPLKSVPRPMPPDEMYRLLKDKHISMVATSDIDGQLLSPELQVLRDDKKAFPPSQMWVLTRIEVAKAQPALKPAIAELAAKISVPILRKLNYEVDVKHRPAKQVVADFLAAK